MELAILIIVSFDLVSLGVFFFLFWKNEKSLTHQPPAPFPIQPQREIDEDSVIVMDDEHEESIQKINK